MDADVDAFMGPLEPRFFAAEHGFAGLHGHIFGIAMRLKGAIVVVMRNVMVFGSCDCAEVIRSVVL